MRGACLRFHPNKQSGFEGVFGRVAILFDGLQKYFLRGQMDNPLGSKKMGHTGRSFLQVLKQNALFSHVAEYSKSLASWKLWCSEAFSESPVSVHGRVPNGDAKHGLLEDQKR